jgi:hypothetical protein
MIKFPEEIQSLIDKVTDQEYFSKIKPEIRKVQHEADEKYNKMILEEYQIALEKVPGLRADEFAKKAAEATGTSERRLRRIFRKAGLIQ